MYTVSFFTFGCKLNQAETAILVEDFISRGYKVVPWGNGSDVSVVNTCTVTGRADAKCRQAIRRILYRFSDTTIVVIGCFSQINSNEISSIAGVDYIFGVQEKLRFFNHFPGPGKLTYPKICVTPVNTEKEDVTYKSGNYLDHTRAFLKIQTGCNNRCSYCIVPLARGPSRSVSFEDVIHQSRTLVNNGFKEIVLTGIHVGEYGKEWEGHSLLPKLLLRLVKIKNLERIRLTSLEPAHLTDELIDCVASNEKICNHFHISLQSGSDRILVTMNRSYTTDRFRRIVDNISMRINSFGLGTDIITGFPGETDKLFEETFQFVDQLPFTYFHVFPFSPRNGTKAALMSNQIEPRIRIERAKRLRTLSEQKKKMFMQQWLHQTVNVLFENRSFKGFMSGFSSEYFRVKIPYDELMINELIPVRIHEISIPFAIGKTIL
jgi:threonylcarbamoyladenosine tRNA methylthiotransferase MtaB